MAYKRNVKADALTTASLSDDARALRAAWWSLNVDATVEVGGSRARSVLSERGQKAVDELIAGGFVTAEQVRDDGRMLYRGLPSMEGIARPSWDEMERIGKWSPTMPNPAFLIGRASV